jgi:hypothetical protein
MIGDVTVTIVWMDNRPDETIEGYSVASAEGVLHITMRMHSGKPSRHIPLCHVREYIVREH